MSILDHVCKKVDKHYLLFHSVPGLYIIVNQSKSWPLRFCSIIYYSCSDL